MGRTVRQISTRREAWPIRGHFAISRGSKTEAVVVVCEIAEGNATGRGECVPYARYGETPESVRAQIDSVAPAIAAGMDRAALQAALPAGAARNAMDCALWDLEAKLTATPVWQLAGLEPPRPQVTAYTIGADAVAHMGATARMVNDRPLIKVKLTGEDDLDRLRAVRENASASHLIVDANEAWTADDLRTLGPALAALDVELIEQPLPAADDAALRGIDCPVPLCADESCHDAASLPALAGKYQVVNIKLDKTGGLTAALALRAAARAAGFQVMVGCMVATSLAMAPAVLVAQGADFVDLDGPLLLARDRDPALRYAGPFVYPPAPALWG